ALAILAGDGGIEFGRLGAGERGVDGPVLLLLECANLFLALDDEAQCHGLHAAGGEAALHLVPKERRDLVANEAVEYTAGLLCIDEVPIDGAWMLKGLFHGALRDLVKRDAVDRDW